MAKGKIIKSLGGFYYIKSENGQVIESRARGNFRHLDITPLVGDDVEYKFEDNSSLGYVEKIYPRKNVLLRPPVANIDQVLILIPVKSPKYNLYLIDKTIALYELENLDILIGINKSDLSDKNAKYINDIYKKAGFKTFITNFQEINNELIEELKYKTTALSGVSGAGKSTLINYVLSKELETSGVSKKTDRGMHTTRHVEIYSGDNGIFLFDTPGFSSLELKDIDAADLKHSFREFRKYEEGCSFNNCNHESEPGCAVKRALENEKISLERYNNYIMLLNEIKNKRRF